MWTKIKILIRTTIISIEKYLSDFFLSKKISSINDVNKKNNTIFLNLTENTYIYRIFYSDLKKIVDTEELSKEIIKLKKLINIKNSYIRINAEIMCQFESINTLKQCQTKTYGMFYNEYEKNMLNLINDLKLISEKYDVVFISEISFNITKYKNDFKLTSENFLHYKNNNAKKNKTSLSGS